MLSHVLVTSEQFQNVKDVLMHETATVQCNATYDRTIVWYYEQYCDDFEHGLYSCSSPSDIHIGHQYQIRTSAAGKHSLLINAVTKDMTGLYACKNRGSQAVIDNVLLNVICKYNFLLLLF